MRQCPRLLYITMLAVAFSVARQSMGGTLDPTNAPGPTMHTLEEIYQRQVAIYQKAETIATPQTLSATTTVVEAGYYEATTLSVVDADLATVNVKSGVTIFGVAGDSNVVDTSSGDAGAGDILTGKKVWVDGSEITGTLPTQGGFSAPEGLLSITIPRGFYSGSTAVTMSDSDLLSTNIMSGVNIFGVAGHSNVVDTTTGDAAPGDILLGKKAWVDGTEVTGTASISSNPAPVPKTGQTTSYATDDDGDLENGAAWPNPRFTDNENGTVTDNLTGLIWLADADAFGIRQWSTALTDCSTLNTDEHGLTDGSSQGDWRLPNRKELASLVLLGNSAPSVPNTAGTGKWTADDPFTDVRSSHYWSSSTYYNDTRYAWVVNFGDGSIPNSSGNKVTIPGGEGGFDTGPAQLYVWPVRGGQ